MVGYGMESYKGYFAQQYGTEPQTVRFHMEPCMIPYMETYQIVNRSYMEPQISYPSWHVEVPYFFRPQSKPIKKQVKLVHIYDQSARIDNRHT